MDLTGEVGKFMSEAIEKLKKHIFPGCSLLLDINEELLNGVPNRKRTTLTLRVLQFNVGPDGKKKHVSSRNEGELEDSKSVQPNNLRPVSSTETGEGSNDTNVEGSYEGRPVPDPVHRLESDQYPVLLAPELRTCSLDALFQSSINSIFPGVDSWSSQELMRNVMSRLSHLHESRKIHGNLNPQNVSITEVRSLRASLSDMGTSFGSSGWEACELLPGRRQSHRISMFSAEMFSAGCVLFFIVTGGKHPFGEPQDREENIRKDKKDLSPVDHLPETKYLFSRLLHQDPKMRPKAWEVRVCFWSPIYKLHFFCWFDSRLKLERPAFVNKLEWEALKLERVALVKKLEREALEYRNWTDKIHPKYRADMKEGGGDENFQGNTYGPVEQLVHWVRNMWTHMADPKNSKEEILQDAEGFYSDIAALFPGLLMKLYGVAYQCC